MDRRYSSHWIVITSADWLHAVGDLFFAYWTAMVTVFEVSPPTVMVTGTALPGVTVVGTSALTSETPTSPGANPEKITGASIPPIVAVVIAWVYESVAPDAGVPSIGGLLTGPRPVQ